MIEIQYFGYTRWGMELSAAGIGFDQFVLCLN